MSLLSNTARFFIAIAFLAFGLEHLVYGEFVTRLIPNLPWIPAHRLLAYLLGFALIAAGVAILLRWHARAASALLGVSLLLSALLLYLPRLFFTPVLGPLWTNTGKVLSLSAAALLVARLPDRDPRYLPVSQPLFSLESAAHLFLAAFLVVAGIQHFLYVSFVAQLVPAWIPGPVFWTYFAGVALIVGGLGIGIPITRKLAALLSGIMILLWVALLHIPRALAVPHDSNETTAVFEALAISGAALLIAALPSRMPRL